MLRFFKGAAIVLLAESALCCGRVEITGSAARTSAESNPPLAELGSGAEEPAFSMGMSGPVGSSDVNPLFSDSGGGAEEPKTTMGIVGGMGPPQVSSAPAIVDAGVAPDAGCVLGAFQAPEALTGLEQGLNPDSQLELWSPALSADGRTLFFAATVDGHELIATATRPDRGTTFSPAVPLSAVNSSSQDGTPLLSADGLRLYFFSTREGGLGKRDIWVSARPSMTADFEAPALVAGVNGADDDHLPWLSPDELTMLWETNRPGGVGGFDIWIARRAFRSDGFSGVAPLDAVNTASTEGRAVLGKDGLTMYFASDRPGTIGSLDLWFTTRSNQEDAFSQITNLASLNSPSSDSDPFLSADEQELMFASDRDGRMQIWRSLRVCD
jgi:hypothetical protein